MARLTRRSLLTTGAVATASMIPGVAPAAVDARMTGLVHVAYFWLARPGSDGDRARLVEGLKTLAGIPTVRALHVGVAANTENRDVVDNSFDVSEVIVFDDVAGQDAYQVHPLPVIGQHSVISPSSRITQ